MTPERQELRDWSAEKLMGWHLSKAGFWCEKNIENYPPVMSYKNWKPDSVDAPASQILCVIERMRELEWYLDLFTGDKDYNAVFFKEIGGGAAHEFSVRQNELQLAVLEAAWATGI